MALLGWQARGPIATRISHATGSVLACIKASHMQRLHGKVVTHALTSGQSLTVFQTGHCQHTCLPPWAIPGTQAYMRPGKGSRHIHSLLFCQPSALIFACPETTLIWRATQMHSLPVPLPPAQSLLAQRRLSGCHTGPQPECAKCLLLSDSAGTEACHQVAH